MKTTLAIIAAAVTITLFSNNSAIAQGYAYQQMQAQLQARTNQAQANLMRAYQLKNARLQNLIRQNIARYRKETGDYRSSDQQVANYLVRKYQQANPQAAAAAHRARMAENSRLFNQTQAAHRQSTNAVNNSYQQIYRTNSAASARSQRNLVDSIHERSNYRNPNTGTTVKLPTYAPNTYYRNSNGTYYQDAHGNYYHFQNGQWTRMNVYNR